MLALPLSGFESREQQNEKRALGRPLHRMCPNSPKKIQNNTGRFFLLNLSPYSTKKRVGVRSSLRHLTHEMYMPNAKTRRQAPNATYIPLEYRLCLLPNAKKCTQKKRNVHGQRKKLASPNARDTNMLVFLALGDAKVLSFALGDAKVPDARYCASGGI